MLLLRPHYRSWGDRHPLANPPQMTCPLDSPAIYIRYASCNFSSCKGKTFLVSPGNVFSFGSDCFLQVLQNTRNERNETLSHLSAASQFCAFCGLSSGVGRWLPQEPRIFSRGAQSFPTEQNGHWSLFPLSSVQFWDLCFDENPWSVPAAPLQSFCHLKRSHTVHETLKIKCFRNFQSFLDAQLMSPCVRSEWKQLSGNDCSGSFFVTPSTLVQKKKTAKNEVIDLRTSDYSVSTEGADRAGLHNSQLITWV